MERKEFTESTSAAVSTDRRENGKWTALIALHSLASRPYQHWILTVCGFIFPVIKANKSASDIEMMQSASLSAGQRHRNRAKFKKHVTAQRFLFTDWKEWEQFNPQETEIFYHRKWDRGVIRESIILDTRRLEDFKSCSHSRSAFSPVSLWTQPLPFFTSTNQVASFPLGPSFTLKANTPPIFFTNCSPSCTKTFHIP